jgi:hypothetical protein
VKTKRTTRRPNGKGEKMHETLTRPEPLFPPNRVSVADASAGAANDVERAAKNAEEIEKSGRVRPDDLQLQVSM